MGNSAISICNLALASLGAAPIRDFGENNKRARQCQIFYDSVRSYLLAKFDWSFARKFQKLNTIDTTSVVIPPGITAYQIPTDCLTPRDVYPPGSSTPWQQFGDQIYTKLTEVKLYYTSDMTNPTKFSRTFVSLLSLGIAIRLGPTITQDKVLVQGLAKQYRIETLECWESDANIGNSYRLYDETPDNDTFVYPDGSAGSEEQEWLPYTD